jgi:hypothetical protein
MDIGRALTFVFDDDEWIKKILIGGIITLIPILGSMLIAGYAVEVVRRAFAASGADELPDWDDIGGYLVNGLVLAAGLFLWLLPLIFLIACVAGGIAIAVSASGDDAVAALSGLILFGLMGLFFLIVVVWSAVLLPVLIGRYAVEGRLGAMFDFDNIVDEIRSIGVMPLLLLVVLYFVSVFIAQLGLLLCLVGVAFTTFYSYVVLAHGVGQVYRAAR